LEQLSLFSIFLIFDKIFRKKCRLKRSAKLLVLSTLFAQIFVGFYHRFSDRFCLSSPQKTQGQAAIPADGLFAKICGIIHLSTPVFTLTDLAKSIQFVPTIKLRCFWIDPFLKNKVYQNVA
jgi:hypothetical protein